MNWVILAVATAFFLVVGFFVVFVGVAEKHGYRKGYRHALDGRKPYWEPYDSGDC